VERATAFWTAALGYVGLVARHAGARCAVLTNLASRPVYYRLASRLKEEEARREAGLVLRQDLLALLRVPGYRCSRDVVAGAEFDRGFGHLSTTTWGFSPLIFVSAEADAGGVRLSSLGPAVP
jgi:hypothetical protein